jgi:dolichyl-phosphate-mannose-protein mannosyltransferase
MPACRERYLTTSPPPEGESQSAEHPDAAELPGGPAPPTTEPPPPAFPGPPPAPPPPRVDFASRYATDQPWAVLDWLLLAAITLLGGALRLVRLSLPKGYIFDEVYYAKDACLYLGHTMAFCHSPGATEQSYVHPELGKWIIAVGEAVFGYNSFGWRIMACLFGTGLVVVAFLIGRKLFGRWGGAIAGLLAATDFLLIVQSRTSMLDIFLAFFVVLGFYFVVCDHQQVLRLRAAGEGRLDLRWRLAAGVAFGCAGAVKWSGLYALAGAGILLLVWHIGTAIRLRRAAEAAGLPRRSPSPVGELDATLLAVGVPVVAIYLLSYVVWFNDHHWSLTAFYNLQRQMYEFNIHLHATHPYASRPWTWPIVKRPVAYYFQSHPATGCAAPHCSYTHILAFGNPGTWWPAIAAVAYIAVQAFRRKHGPERLLLVAIAVQYLPWFEFSRTSFLYYMTPVVPFTMLALTGALHDLARLGKFWAGAVGVYLVFACGGLLWFWYPVITGVTIPVAWWQQRMLEGSFFHWI